MSLQIDQFFERHRPARICDVVGNAPTKEKLYKLVRRDGLPRGTLIEGPSGCGKTTLARIIARTISCHNISAEHPDPCNQCPHCSGTRWLVNFEGGITECNAADLTIKDLKSHCEIAYHVNPVPPVFIYDELHRANGRIQDVMVSMLEDTQADFALIFGTLEPEAVEPALLQRLLSLEVRPPTTDEMVSHMLRVCSIEGWSHAERDLRRIAELNGNVPRVCLNALLQFSL